MKQLVVATGNPGKVREFSAALAAEGFEVHGLEALADRSDVEETGTTFEANARLKAEAYSRRTGMLVVADDSGIVVDALDGRPGVKSARYGGANLDDKGRNRLMLEELEGVPDERRTARFVCVIALARAGKTLAVFDGTIEGRIAHEPAGDNGFGYDPLFFHPPSGCTTAQLSVEEKRKVSHRGEAIGKLVDALHSGALAL